MPCRLACSRAARPHVRTVEVERGCQGLAFLLGKLCKFLHLRDARAVERVDIGPIDFDQVASRIAQVHLHATVRQLVDGVAECHHVEHAEFLSGFIDGVEIIEDAKVLRLKPFTQLGTPMEIIKGAFGGKAGYEAALRELEDQIYEQASNT